MHYKSVISSAASMPTSKNVHLRTHSGALLPSNLRSLWKKQVSWDTVDYPSTTLFHLKARVKPVRVNSSLGKPVLFDIEMDWEVQGVNCHAQGEGPTTSHSRLRRHLTTTATARFTVPQILYRIPTSHPATSVSARSSGPNRYLCWPLVIRIGQQGTG